MINFILWTLAIIPITIFSVVFFGALYASVCDWWYQRKYAVWIALQNKE
jgi:hypothetical protein